MNPGIHFKFELHVTDKLDTAACSSSDADTHIFPNQYNSSSCSSLSVCNNTVQYIGMNVRLSEENEKVDNGDLVSI